MCVHIALVSGDEERARVVQLEQAAEIQITTIHDVEGSGPEDEQVQHIDIVHLTLQDVNKGGVLPHKLSSVCSLTAARAMRNGAQRNSDRHRSMDDGNRCHACR